MRALRALPGSSSYTEIAEISENRTEIYGRSTGFAVIVIISGTIVTV